MLFDLRSRGRRTTVRGVYLGLAILIGGGLILFGVGTGVGGGGLLNAFNGGGGSQNQVVSAAERNAEKAVKAHPNSASAWGSLLQARWTTATTTGSGFSSATGTFTALGKSELRKLTQDWQRYKSLVKSPAGVEAILAARAYGILGQYSNAADAWDALTIAEPNSPAGYDCLAVSAYAAGQTDKGNLATNKALALVSKTQRLSLKTTLSQAKKSPTSAQTIIRQSCVQ